MTSISRRMMPNVPRLAGIAWESANQPLEEYIRKFREAWAEGIPPGFNGFNPTVIQADTVSDPGTELLGWAASDHAHFVSTGVPVPIGKELDEGVATSLARSDHVHTAPLALVDVSSSPYTVVSTDDVILVDASGGAVTINLTAASLNLGRLLWVKKVDSSNYFVTVDGDGAETIDGDADFDLEREDESITLTCDGTEWWII